MASAKEFLAKHGLAIGSPSTIVFNSNGTLQAAALSGATFAITSVDLDGGTDIGADLADADLFLVDDGAGGTNRKSALSRVKKYIYSAVSGDATVSDSGALTIASGSVENAMLAGSIANSKLTNSTVSFGGVSLALGASDATPAFDLSDATNYPTSSLSGTITNAQLAGSIANSKLTNSTITVSDGSNSTATALGGTITFAGTSGEVDVAESSGTVTIGLPSDVTIGNDLVVTGDLTVSGTTTTINSNTLNIGDNIITLNSDVTGTPTQNAGIEVERGTGNNVQLRWNETSDKWQFTNDGSTFSDLGAGLTIQEEGSALSTAAQTLNFVGAAVTATGSGTTKTITISGGDIVNDTTPQLGGNLDLNSSNITGTGNINITGTSTVSGLTSISGAQFSGNVTPTGGQGVEIFAPDSSTGQIQSFDRANSNFDKLIIKGDPVEIYDGSTKTIETTNSGVTVTGNIVVSGTVDGVDVAALNTSVSGKLSDVVDDTSPQLGGDLDLNSNSITGSGHIDIGDDNRLKLGASDDLQIYHDGSHSYINESGTGYLIIKSSELQIQSDGGEDMAKFEPDGSVRLYHNNVEKITTTSAGATVSGTLTATAFSGDGSGLTGVAASVSNGSNDRVLTSSGGNGINAESDFQFDGTNVFIPNEIRHIGDPDTKVGFTTDTITLTAGGVAVQTLTTSGTSTSALTVTGATNLGTVQAETLAIENPASHHTYTVTVASKTSAHPYTGQGSSSAYFLDGKEAPSIILAPNMTYRFDQADNTNSGHPLRFYLDAAKTTAYTTGVTTNGTAGSSGAYTQIVVTDATPPCLYYQCSSHGYMGSVANALGKGTTDHLTEGSTNLYYTDARVNAHLNVSGASSGQILSWNGSDYAWVADQTGGGGSSLTVQDEGSALSTAATTLNFVGAGVTASGTGATKTITISGGGGGSSLSVKDEGSALSTAATTLNFVGAGVVASGTGAEKTITISGGGSGITVQDEGSSLSTVGTTLNFVGSGVTASGTGATKTITISGGGGSSSSADFGGQFTSDTGNGSTTTFTSPVSTNLANNIIVSVDGIMQRPTTDYTVSGTTVTFGTAPPSGTAVLVRSFSGAINSKADLNVQNFTANGSNTVYKLAESVTSGDNVLVSINGIIQKSGTDYTYNTGTSNITFDEAPTLNDNISFRTFDIQSASGFNYEAVSSNIDLVASGAYLVDCSSARTLTLPSSATMGDEIRIIDATGQSGTNNITVSRNSHKIQGAASDLTISTNRAAFGLVYFNVAQGWLLTER